MIKEEWKPVKGYETRYYVSSYGNIVSLKFVETKRNSKIKKIKVSPLNPSTDSNGYKIVKLYLNGKAKYFKLHRIVAETFLPNKNNFPQVNHKNEIKTDNKIDNLEWCSSKYNNNYGTRLNRVKTKLSKEIIQYTLDGKYVATWKSLSEIKKAGYSSSQICKICNGKYYKDNINGYKWKFRKEIF